MSLLNYLNFGIADWILIVFWSIIGIWELVYILSNVATISQRYQRLYPKWIDSIIGFTLLGFFMCAWFIHPAVRVFSIFWVGHIFIPNKETYKKEGV